MKKLYAVLFAALFGVSLAMAGVLAAASGHKDDDNEREFKAKLTGFQETPAISTTGNGRFTAMLSDDGTTLTFTLTYSDLSGGAATAAHIHLGQKNVAGGVSVFLCGGAKPACPGASGTVTGTRTAADVIGPTGQGIAAGEFAELVAAMRAGVTYVNIHNAMFPSGEIRGQISED